MISIIAGTNRRNNEALQFARHYKQVIESKTAEPVTLLNLESIPHDWFHPGMYTAQEQSLSLAQLQDEYILAADSFVFIIPEYNGSFPGVLKLFLDACSIRQNRENFSGKKVILTGIASGRAGNLRGMDHLTGILHHLGAIVLPNKLPISSIEKLMDPTGEIMDLPTLRAIEKQIEEFLHF